jgi:membrane protein implicated in regulation of membrane protease activity
LAAGGSFGAITAFLWVNYSETIGLLFGLLFISVVTGVRFYSIFDKAPDKSVQEFVDKKTELVSQLRKEGHYTISAFTVASSIVYIILGLL